MLPLVLALALAAPAPRDPAEAAASRLLASTPGAVALRAPGGGLAHLSAIAVPSSGDEAGARRFLEARAAAFGIEALEAVRVDVAPRAPGQATFRRLVDGLPVFGGDVTVAWRADGAITLVNGSTALAVERAGAHRIGAADAVRTALAAGPEAGEIAAEPGWIEYGGRLLPVVRVAHGALLDASYSYVDASSGALLWRTRRARRLAPTPWAAPCPPGGPCLRANLVSPLDPPPAGAGANAPLDFALPAGWSQTTLSGDRTAVYDCAGYDLNQGRAPPTFPLGFPLDCESPHLVVAGGTPVGGQTATFTPASTPPGFVADPDPTQIQLDDRFAQQSAYFHLDAHSRFLDALSPGIAALVGFVPGYVNVTDHGPLDNAYFAPSVGPSGAMIFGQGARADLAYDAGVLYHELTHAAVDRTARFEGFPDALGVDSDPDAINEGTADTFAFAHAGESLASAGVDVGSASCMSRYYGASLGLECLRDARSERTCRGAGPNVGRNPGRTGEVHDDGEIWTGFTWALYEAAAAQDALQPSATATGRRSFQVARAIFQASTAAGSRPSFSTLAASVRQKLHDLGVGADAEAYAACLAAQRDLAGCDDRAVPLYSGERARGVLWGLTAASAGVTPAAQQYVVDVPCGATALRVRAGDDAGTGTVYVRYGRPVQMTSPPLGGAQYDWVVRGNQPEAVIDAAGCERCSACGPGRTGAGAGRWYLLAVGDGGSVYDVGVTIDVPGGAPARPAFALGTCTWGGGPAPAGGSAPFPAAASLACAAPAAAPSCNVAQAITGPAGRSGSGCGCATGSPEGTLLAVVGLLALRWHSRRGRPKLSR